MKNPLMPRKYSARCQKLKRSSGREKYHDAAPDLIRGLFLHHKAPDQVRGGVVSVAGIA